jgi:hypothetical protein
MPDSPENQAKSLDGFLGTFADIEVVQHGQFCFKNVKDSVTDAVRLAIKGKDRWSGHWQIGANIDGESVMFITVLFAAFFHT